MPPRKSSKPRKKRVQPPQHKPAWLTPQLVQMIVALVVTVVWATSVIIDAIDSKYAVAEEVHAAMGAVIGLILTRGYIQHKQNGD